MKKHFLLALMTLLPFMGAWAQNETGTTTSTKTKVWVDTKGLYKDYGQPDPAPQFILVNAATGAELTPEQVGITNLAEVVMLRPNGETPGSYDYTVNVGLADESENFTYDTEHYTLEKRNVNPLIIRQAPLSLQSIKVNGIEASYPWTGSAIEPKPTSVIYENTILNPSTQTLVEGEDYEVSWENNQNVTTEDAPAYVVVKGKGEFYKGEVKIPFQIVPVEVDAEKIKVVVDPAEYTFTGSPIDPVVTVTYNPGTPLEPVQLTLGTDYEIDFADADKINVGTVNFKVVLKGNYSGEKEASYEITPKSIEDKTNEVYDVTIVIEPESAVYNGKPTKPVPTVTWGQISLREKVEGAEAGDYTVAWGENISAKGTVIVKGTGNYTGERTVEFAINKRALSSISQNFAVKNLTWNGQAQPTEITTWKINGQDVLDLLAEGYTIYYDENPENTEGVVEAGTHKVTIKAADEDPNFKGTKTAVFQVAKAELTAKVKDIEVAFGTSWESKYELENVAVANGGELTADMEAAVKKFATADKFSVTLGEDNIAHVGVEYPISFDAGNGTENFTIRVVDGALTVTAAEVWAEIDVYHQNSDDHVSYERSADAPQPYVLSYGEEYALGLKYDSGLEGIVVEGDAAEYFAERIAGQNVAFIVKDSEGKEIEGSHPTDAGTYDVSVAAFQAGDYIVYTKDDQFVIEGIDISDDLTVNVELEDCVYNGTQWKPGKDAIFVTYKGSEVEDFEIIGYGENLNAGEGTVEIKVSNGNMEGTATGRFDIRKRDIVIKAEDDEKSYADVVNKNAKYEKGAVVIVDENEEITEENAADDIAVKELAELLKNPEYVEVKFVIGVPSSAGNHPEALEATLIASEEALAASAFKNYDIVETQRGTLEILKQDLVLKVKNFEFVYGDPVVIPADYQPEYVSGLISSSQEAALYSSIVKNLQFEVAAPADEDNGKYVVGKEYAITASATATNYNVVFNDDAVVTISKRPVTVKPEAQEVEYGQEINEKGYVITKGSLGYQDDDLGITVETTVTAIGTTANAIFVNVSAANPNYDITVADYDEENQGAPVNITATEFVLHRVHKVDFDNPERNDAAQLIKDFDKQTVATVKIEHFNDHYEKIGQNLVADKWYALVLPFDVTIRELNRKFGYVVVNVFDVNNTNKKQISFKLELNGIPANTPFVFKVDAGEEGDVRDLSKLTFENKEIVNGGPVVYVGDASGMKFIGSYTGKIGFKSNEYYFQISTALDPNKYYSGNDTNTTMLRPCGAYLSEELAAGEEAGTRTIIFQESDGSLTTVKAIDANTFVNAEGWYTIDGKKLEAVPTQKGVYINNGKKVVIK